MLGFAISLWLTHFGPAASHRACILELHPPVNPWAEPNYVVAKATPDTLSDGPYYYTMGTKEGFQRIPLYSRQLPITVFGQVLELQEAAGRYSDRVRRHRRILVIWWNFGAACTRSLPSPVRRFQTGRLLIIKAPRSPEDWVAGLPTYDVDFADAVFVPPPDSLRKARQEPGGHKRPSPPTW